MFGLVGKEHGYLFATHGLREALERTTAQIRTEVDAIEGNRLLNTAPADLEKYFLEKYRVEVPRLAARDKWVQDSKETKVDVRNDFDRMIMDRSRPALVPGQEIEIEIPFEGDAEIFFARASRFTTSPPRAEVRGQTLVLSYKMAHDRPVDIAPALEGTIKEIEEHLTWCRNDADTFNASLPSMVAAAIEQRRSRLLANQRRAASLGIPLKARPGAAATYAVPTVRRKVVPTLPVASSVPYIPEPALDDALYDHILKVLHDMTMVMERSPSAFATMGEEDLRNHFLMALNAQFEGAATGETFNLSGKTDILLRYENRNIFIAECKFWEGISSFEKALDQLEPLLKIPCYLSPGWLKIDPNFDPLRGNPRFERLVKGT